MKCADAAFAFGELFNSCYERFDLTVTEKHCPGRLTLTFSHISGIIATNQIATTAIETSKPTPRCPASLKLV